MHNVHPMQVGNRIQQRPRILSDHFLFERPELLNHVAEAATGQELHEDVGLVLVGLEAKEGGYVLVAEGF